MERKLSELRPAECGTRIGDVIEIRDGERVIKVKCRRCSKTAGKDVFHYVVADPVLGFSCAAPIRK